jgi:hypothetical protein
VVLAVFSVQRRDVLRHQPYADAAEYAEAAYNLARGAGYVTTYAFGGPRAVHASPQPALHPPGYSLALAPFAAFWPAFPVGAQLGAQFYAAAYFLVAVGLAWALAGPLAAALAAGFLGLSPFTYASATLVMSDAFAASLMVGQVWLVRRPTAARTAAAGVVGGVAVWARLTNLVGLAALALALPQRWRARAVAFALPLVAGLAVYQWMVFGSPLTTGYAYYVPNFRQFDVARVFGRHAAAGAPAVWGDNLNTRFEQLWCGCRSRFPLSMTPNAVYFPAVLLGLVWTFGPPLTAVPGVAELVRRRQAPAARLVLWQTGLHLALVLPTVQYERLLAGPATLLVVYGAAAGAGWLERQLSTGTAASAKTCA